MKQAMLAKDSALILENVLHVPRETITKLTTFADLLVKWNQSLNLISKNTTDDLWLRHIVDSAQLMQYIEPAEEVLDIGSGAGFPGVVLAIVNGNKVILVEKSKKKCAFLQEVKAKIVPNIDVRNEIIEQTNINNIDIITCRAWASLIKILELTQGFFSPRTKLILLKGVDYKQEVNEAKNKGWQFDMMIKTSLTNAEGVALILSNVNKKL